MLRLASDVHTEFLQPRKALAWAARMAPLPGERVLVLAGDLGKVLNSHGTLNNALTDVLLALHAQRTEGQHIVYVPGNHEYYGAAEHGLTADVVDALLERWCMAHGIVFLQRRTWTLPDTDVVFVGCTLWSDATDVALDGCNDVDMALGSPRRLPRPPHPARSVATLDAATTPGAGRRCDAPPPDPCVRSPRVRPLRISGKRLRHRPPHRSLPGARASVAPRAQPRVHGRPCRLRARAEQPRGTQASARSRRRRTSLWIYDMLYPKDSILSEHFFRTLGIFVRHHSIFFRSFFLQILKRHPHGSSFVPPPLCPQVIPPPEL